MSRRTDFKGVVLGLSGGINSALCAAIGVDALGAERVRALMLPYKFTSEESLADAAKVAKALGIRYDIAPIESAVLGLEQALAPMFKGLPRDVTEENLQARARGTILMGISNKFGLMVMTTGNKSEMSVGYATLYGDMNGGFNPIKDLYKTEVFRISRLRNEWKPDFAFGPSGRVIPENAITKPPTAELRENQKDQDSLPPYEILDAILERLVEREEPIEKIVEAGFDRATVMRVDRMLNLAEYKRRQAAPGVKVTLRSFGRDRRYPITNRFRDPGTPVAQGRSVAGQRTAVQKRSLRFLISRLSAPGRAADRPCGSRAWARRWPALARPRRAARAPRRRSPSDRACPSRGRIGRPLASRGAFIAFARSSVTTMSPCSMVERSSRPFSASAQVSPCLLQEQAALNSCRNLKAFGNSL